MRLVAHRASWGVLAVTLHVVYYPRGVDGVVEGDESTHPEWHALHDLIGSDLRQVGLCEDSQTIVPTFDGDHHHLARFNPQSRALPDCPDIRAEAAAVVGFMKKLSELDLDEARRASVLSWAVTFHQFGNWFFPCIRDIGGRNTTEFHRAGCEVLRTPVRPIADRHGRLARSGRTTWLLGNGHVHRYQTPDDHTVWMDCADKCDLPEGVLREADTNFLAAGCDGGVSLKELEELDQVTDPTGLRLDQQVLWSTEYPPRSLDYESDESCRSFILRREYR